MLEKRSRPIYLDYHSTTPVDPRVAELMLYYMTTAFGNASSLDHAYGDEAKEAVSKAAKQVAELIGCSHKEVVFTSGATESINLAIQGHIASITGSQIKPRIALMALEHKAVLDTCHKMAKKGLVDVVELRVDSKGRLDLNYLESVCRKGLSLLSVMAANNEIGNIYPIKRVGHIAEKYNIPFLCDASQAVGKIPIDFNGYGITYLAISAHKLYGPKGVGALVVKKGSSIEPIIYGGGHQRGIRSGTLNVAGIVGFGEACRLRRIEMDVDEKLIANRRNRLEAALKSKIPGLVVNGDPESRLAGNLHISIPQIPNDAIIARVRSKLAISTGAACTSGVEEPSHVLQSLKMPLEMMTGALRIGVGKYTTDEEVELAADFISTAVHQVRKLQNAVA